MDRCSGEFVDFRTKQKSAAVASSKRGKWSFSRQFQRNGRNLAKRKRICFSGRAVWPRSTHLGRRGRHQRAPGAFAPRAGQLRRIYLCRRQTEWSSLIADGSISEFPWLGPFLQRGSAAG